MRPYKLFPKAKPYRRGYFNAGDGHRLYYALHGNPKGKPVLYVHGGPGGGCGPSSPRFFSPKVWNIVLLDQRGSGKSKPFASTRANTTGKLVGDIRHLLKFLKIRKVFLFGGSWGSTLSLAYAIKYPETVTGMLLRGIFLSREADISGMYAMDGLARQLFPDAFERFIRLVPKRSRNYWRKVVRYYLGKMKSKNAAVARKHAYEWAYYEMSMLKLDMPRKEILKTFREFTYKSLAIMEAHYMINDCFLPKNFILKNARRIAARKIPVSIVHGRYDVICPAIQAWLLHKALPGSRLTYTLSGHGSGDPALTAKLVGEMKRMEKIIR